MKTLHLHVSKPYDVLLESGLIKRTYKLIEPFCKGRNVAIITDDIVDRLYGESLLRQLKESGYSVVKYALPNGELSKNINTLSNILEFLAENNFKRNDYMIALGGGVPGDITGLASAIYMRGIGFIQIPTTLLAMVDASVGGKTAIDLKAGKNLAGAFWQPSLVICDIDIIKNLPENIFKEGMGEVLKYDIIDNLGIFESVLNDNVEENLESIIYECIRSKQQIVEQDEFETKGVRKLLNVGHTFAHGLEKLSSYSIPHGFAVATGLVWEAGIAYELGICSLELFETIKRVVKKWNLLVNFEYSNAELVEAMKKDKKNNDNSISFVLPIELGDCREKKLKAEETISILESVGELI